ncbi:MAG: hypothetical protein KME11_12950 [Timaviella obliquedivisa GSE-PSE-MK23-08B]|jgi:hypothetical protein|nr:hypothetical protein [Timaviella obliquedivisa GSE-PSE-MK23-08B]
MELSSLSAEIIFSHSHSVLGHLSLQGNLQPGGYLEFEGQTYLVLERRHHYHLKAGRYQMSKVALYVQKFDAPADMSLVNGYWVIGDVTCLYNARSELLRCAINPEGSCDRCLHRQPIQSS